MLHIPESFESVLDTVVEVAVVVDLQASHSCAVQKFIQIVLRIRSKAVTDFAPPVVILVSVVSGFSEGEEVPVVLIEIKSLELRMLKTTVERAPILNEIGSGISWKCQALAVVLIAVHSNKF
jgi:hypothetical protein